MTAATNAVMTLTLAMLISLGQWLGDGMAAFEKGDYKAASALFTKVIDAKGDYNPDKQTALYMRAQCFAKLKLKKEAAKDLETLLTSYPHEQLATLAGADYKKITGKEWQGDRSTPEATWRTFVRALENHDVNAVHRCLSGEAAIELGQALVQPQFFQMMAAEIGPLISVAYNKDKSRALIIFAEGGKPGKTEEVIMSKAKGVWTVSEEYSRNKHAAEFGEAKAPSKVPPKPVVISDEDAATIGILIKQLGADSFRDRKNAYDKLNAMGAIPTEQLKEATTNPDPEISTRAKKLLGEM